MRWMAQWYVLWRWDISLSVCIKAKVVQRIGMARMQLVSLLRVVCISIRLKQGILLRHGRC